MHTVFSIYIADKTQELYLCPYYYMDAPRGH